MMFGGPKRFWDDARTKVDAENVCRGCGRSGDEVRLEFAHTIGRKYDDYKLCIVCDGSGRRLSGAGECKRCDGTGVSRTRYVDPASGLPLCGPNADPNSCHGKQERGELDLLPLMTLEEQLYAVKKLEGIENARVILAPSAYRSAP
jgi:hypothetical protein